MSIEYLENSVSAAIGNDRLSWRERVAVRKKLGELVTKAALFDEMRELLDEAEHDIRQRAMPDAEWLSKTRDILVKANKVAEIKP